MLCDLSVVKAELKDVAAPLYMLKEVNEMLELDAVIWNVVDDEATGVAAMALMEEEEVETSPCFTDETVVTITSWLFVKEL